MPAKAKRPCLKHGCPALVDSGFCPAHRKQATISRVEEDRQRGTSTERGYDGQWRKFRRLYLARAENVLCKDCLRAVATDLHHQLKLADCPELKYDENNLRGLCGRCHKKRTARGE